MQIEITNKFRKQVDKCKDTKIKKNLLLLITNTQQANKLSELKNIKKLKGKKHYYRARIGDYRIGLVLQNKKLVFAAFDHRSDIYKYFP